MEMSASLATDHAEPSPCERDPSLTLRIHIDLSETQQFFY